MKAATYIAAVFLLVGAVAFGAPPLDSIGDVQSVGRSPSAASEHNDDVQACFGNDDDACWEWDTGAAADNFRAVLTDCDGAGTDCAALYWATGTDDAVMSGTLSIGGTAAGAKLSPGGTDGDLLIGNAAGTQGIKLDTAGGDGQLRIYDESGGNATLYATGQVFYATGGSGGVVTAGDTDTGMKRLSADQLSLLAGNKSLILIEGDRDYIEFADWDLDVDSYEVHYVIPPGAASLGPTAPAWTVNGLVGGLGFDNDNELVFINFEIPNTWDGASDLALKVYWVGENTDAVADTEKVQWDFQYHSIVWGTEDHDNGTPVTVTTVHTQSGAADNEATFETTLVLDFDHADQTLTAGDVVLGKFNRNVTAEAGDAYSGDAIVQHWEVKVMENGLKRDHLN